MSNHPFITSFHFNAHSTHSWAGPPLLQHLGTASRETSPVQNIQLLQKENTGTKPAEIFIWIKILSLNTFIVKSRDSRGWFQRQFCPSTMTSPHPIKNVFLMNCSKSRSQEKGLEQEQMVSQGHLQQDTDLSCPVPCPCPELVWLGHPSWEQEMSKEVIALLM